MGNYYFLAPLLPDLTLGEKPDLCFGELKELIEVNLTKEDKQKARLFRRFIDLLNVRSLLADEPLDPRGTLSEKELDEALLIHAEMPDYVFAFLDRFGSEEEKVRHFSGLIAHFFAEEMPQQRGFLRQYLSFEREWRLVLTAMRGKRLGRDLVQELQYEEPSDPFVAQIIAQKDAESYEPPEEYQELKELFRQSGEDPWRQHRAFAAWRLKKIEEIVVRPLFSIDWILAYIARLLIVEQDLLLDAERGKSIVSSILQQ